MAASSETVSRVVVVMLRHMTRRRAQAVARDLLEVPGNKSFRDTVVALNRALKVEETEDGE